MYRNDGPYYSLVVFGLMMLGISIYQYRTNPPIKNLPDFLELTQASQFKPAILLALFVGTALIIAYIAYQSIKRAWSKFYEGEMTHGLISLAICGSAAAGCYSFSSYTLNKFTFLIVAGALVAFFMIDTNSTRKN
ncbi:hypothetical protein [Bacillus infantis]|uniref:Uncharacterized protein n=1 Tax=Bacillus infantis TaxID=324767 RepID=A0A5D4R953_9BACI|nr:hypothetical protein [Bacillus infantis]TYS46751.1 hypothetical protein FZD51_14865 [Bacillus infantis]